MKSREERRARDEQMAETRETLETALHEAVKELSGLLGDPAEDTERTRNFSIAVALTAATIDDLPTGNEVVMSYRELSRYVRTLEEACRHPNMSTGERRKQVEGVVRDLRYFLDDDPDTIRLAAELEADTRRRRVEPPLSGSAFNHPDDE